MKRPNFSDRLTAASEAKRAQLERARAIAEDPQRLDRLRARSEAIAAREARSRNAKRLAERRKNAKRRSQRRGQPPGPALPGRGGKGRKGVSPPRRPQLEAY